MCGCSGNGNQTRVIKEVKSVKSMKVISEGSGSVKAPTSNTSKIIASKPSLPKKTSNIVGRSIAVDNSEDIRKTIAFKGKGFVITKSGSIKRF